MDGARGNLVARRVSRVRGGAGRSEGLDGRHPAAPGRWSQRRVPDAVDPCLLARLGFSLADATWTKYPGVCPYCIRDAGRDWRQLADVPAPTDPDAGFVFRDCQCTPPRPEYDDLKDLLRPFRQRLDARPSTITGFERMFDLLYGSSHAGMEFAAIAFHVHEEVGEVIKEIENRDYERCPEEVADVFSWLASLAAEPDFRSHSGYGFGIEEALRREYGGPEHPW